MGKENETRRVTALELLNKTRNKDLRRILLSKKGKNSAVFQQITYAIHDLPNEEHDKFVDSLIQGLGQDNAAWDTDRRDCALLLLPQARLENVDPISLTVNYAQAIGKQVSNDTVSPLGSIDSLLDAGKIVAPHVGFNIDMRNAILDTWNMVEKKMIDHPEWEILSPKLDELKTELAFSYIETHSSARTAENRKVIYQNYEKTSQEIANLLSISLGTINSNIAWLKTHGLIIKDRRKDRKRNSREYKPFEKTRVNDSTIVILHTQGISLKEIAARTKLKVKTVANHIIKLRKRGIISWEKKLSLPQAKQVLISHKQGMTPEGIANQMNISLNAVSALCSLPEENLIQEPLSYETRSSYNHSRKQSQKEMKHIPQTVEEVSNIIKDSVVENIGSQKNFVNHVNTSMSQWNGNIEIDAPHILAHISAAVDTSHVSLDQLLKEWKMISPYLAQDTPFNKKLLSIWNKIAQKVEKNSQLLPVVSDINGIRLRLGIIYIEKQIDRYVWPRQSSLFATLSHNPEMTNVEVEQKIKTMEYYDTQPRIAQRRELFLLYVLQGMSNKEIMELLNISYSTAITDRKFLIQEGILENPKESKEKTTMDNLPSSATIFTPKS